ncbi:MAG: hypothetical protein ACM3ZC_07485 [Bacteroidota bacterium]
MGTKPHVRFVHLLLFVFFLNFLGAQMLHEGGHWAVLRIGGRDPVFGFTGLVQKWDKEPVTPDQWVMFTDPHGDRGWLRLGSLPDSRTEWVIFIAAGPLLQLAAVILGLMLNSLARRQTTRLFGLLLALINSFGQLMYQVIAPIRGSGGDEYLLAYHLGVPRAVISVFLAAAFAVGLVLAFHRLDGWRQRLIYGAALFIGINLQGPLLMYANQVVQDQIDAGNPFFQPVCGFSLPVLIAVLFTALALLAVAKAHGTRYRLGKGAGHEQSL